MSIGTKLKKAREEKGFTCMEVAEATHMLVQMVREIEADDFHRFAAPVYGKGFIKLFANAVGLDPAPLIAEFIASQNEAAKAPKSTIPKIAPQPKPVPVPPKTESAPTDKVTEADVEEPSDPRSKRLKASSVTLPRADSPFSPANQPPARQPAAPRPPADEAEKKAQQKPLTAPPPESKQDRTATSKQGEAPPPRRTDVPAQDHDAFALQSDTVTSDTLPEPPEKQHEPFKFPTRAQPASPPDTPKRRTAQRRNDFHPPGSERRRPEILGAIIQGFTQLGNLFRALSEQITAAFSMDNDEDSRIRKRYALTGVLVCITVLTVIIIATSGSGKSPENGDTLPPSELAETSQHPPTALPLEETEPEVLPTEPVQIVRVLPAPKMFAQ